MLKIGLATYVIQKRYRSIGLWLKPRRRKSIILENVTYNIKVLFITSTSS